MKCIGNSVLQSISSEVENCGDPTTNLSTRNLLAASGSVPIVTTINAAFSARCQVGYRFSDLSDVNLLTCQLGGVWTNIATCMRIHF